MRNGYVHTNYPAVRRVMGADRVRLDDAALEAYLESSFPDVAPEDVEDFMGTLQRFGRDAAPVAQRVLPGVASGAASGAALGPWGALAGGIVGGASSLLSKGPTRSGPTLAGGIVGGASSLLSKGPTRSGPTGGTPLGAPPPTPPTVPGAAVGSLGVVPDPGQPAAAAIAQLLALLSRPETMQALLALLMPSAGRPSVAVGQQQVPPAAFANAIAELATIAATDESLPDAALQDHLYDDDGRPRGDLANPTERAALLIADLADVAHAESDEGWIDDNRQDTATWDNPLDSYERNANGWNPNV